MPNHVKTMISLAALAAALTVFYLDSRAGAGASRWVALGLGPLAVFAIWVFPEAKSREVRKDAARRRASG